MSDLVEALGGSHAKKEKGEKKKWEYMELGSWKEWTRKERLLVEEAAWY